MGFKLGIGRYQTKAEDVSHAETIVCGSNCIVMHFTGKECDVAP